MKVRTLIVEDEKPARERIKRFLAEHKDFEIVGEAGDGDTAVRLIEELEPDLVFLDVQLPEADGFEVLRRLKTIPRIIFATAHERYAVQAFEVASVDYLLKPFDRKRFGAALARVRDEMARKVGGGHELDALLREIRDSARALREAAGSSEALRSHETAPGPAAAGAAPAASDRIPCRRGQRIYLLSPKEILWFEAEGELVFACSVAHRYHVSRTLAELEAALDPKSFFRSHRSYIVNLAAVAEIIPEDAGNYRIILKEPARRSVPLSRRQARKLREVFPW